MAGKTVTRSDLSEIVYNTVGLSRSESAQIVETVLDEISDALIRGEDVKLSSFGSFLIRHKNGRIGRNPKQVRKCRLNRVVFSAFAPAMSSRKNQQNGRPRLKQVHDVRKIRKRLSHH